VLPRPVSRKTGMCPQMINRDYQDLSMCNLLIYNVIS
jgi:hypothetical protein